MSTSATETPCVPARMSLDDLHALAVEAAAVGNRGRLALAQALWAIHESGRVQTFGFPSVAAYAPVSSRSTRPST